MADHAVGKDVVLRAWKDEQYRQTLPAELRESLPPKPDDFGEMSDDQLEQAAGAGTPAIVGAGAALVGGGAALASGIDALLDDSGAEG